MPRIPLRDSRVERALWQKKQWHTSELTCWVSQYVYAQDQPVILSRTSHCEHGIMSPRLGPVHVTCHKPGPEIHTIMNRPTMYPKNDVSCHRRNVAMNDRSADKYRTSSVSSCIPRHLYQHLHVDSSPRGQHERSLSIRSHICFVPLCENFAIRDEEMV